MSAKYVERMIQSSPAKPVEGAALGACIEACIDCAQACVACADACLGEQDPKPLARCIRQNLDCADLCTATSRILSRHIFTDSELLHRTLHACAFACQLCGDECERHGQHGMEHCQVCAEACRRCEQACNELITQLAT